MQAGQPGFRKGRRIYVRRVCEGPECTYWLGALRQGDADRHHAVRGYAVASRFDGASKPHHSSDAVEVSVAQFAQHQVEDDSEG